MSLQLKGAFSEHSPESQVHLLPLPLDLFPKACFKTIWFPSRISRFSFNEINYFKS